MRIPGFERDGLKWTWRGDGKVPSDDALIDWFQMTHPAQAYEIERGLDA